MNKDKRFFRITFWTIIIFNILITLFVVGGIGWLAYQLAKKFIL